MKVRLASGKVTRDSHGRKGGRLKITTPTGEPWAGVYSLDTHGLSAEQVNAKVARLETHHAKKSARFTGFRSVCAAPFEVADQPFRITDCVLLDVGEPGGDVELRIYARRRNINLPELSGVAETRSEAADGERIGRPFFPIIIAADDVDALPSDEDIVALVQNRIADMLGDEAENEQVLSELRTLETV